MLLCNSEHVFFKDVVLVISNILFEYRCVFTIL